MKRWAATADAQTKLCLSSSWDRLFPCLLSKKYFFIYYDGLRRQRNEMDESIYTLSKHHPTPKPPNQPARRTKMEEKKEKAKKDKKSEKVALT